MRPSDQPKSAVRHFSVRRLQRFASSDAVSCMSFLAQAIVRADFGQRLRPLADWPAGCKPSRLGTAGVGESAVRVRRPGAVVLRRRSCCLAPDDRQQSEGSIRRLLVRPANAALMADCAGLEQAQNSRAALFAPLHSGETALIRGSRRRRRSRSSLPPCHRGASDSRPRIDALAAVPMRHRAHRLQALLLPQGSMLARLDGPGTQGRRRRLPLVLTVHASRQREPGRCRRFDCERSQELLGPRSVRRLSGVP